MFTNFSFNSSSEAGPTEKCKLGNTVIDIPQELCEQKALFNEVVSMETWEKVLSSDHRNHLMKFLPTFPESDVNNKRQVIRSLFARDNFKFGNPLNQFHKKLKDGAYSPEMTAMAAVLQQAKRQDYLYRQQRYYNKLLQEILISRKNLLDAAEHFSADQPIRLERLQPKPRLQHRIFGDTVEQRTKKRYMRELQEMREEVGELDTSSEDENYPEGLPVKCPKRNKKQSQSESTALTATTPVYGTLAPKPQSNAAGSGGNFYTRSTSPFDITEDGYHEMLLKHKRRRMENKTHPDLDTVGVSLRDVGARANLPKRPVAKPVPTTEVPVKRRAARDRERAERRKAAAAASAALSATAAVDESFASAPTPLSPPQQPVVKVEPNTGHEDPPAEPIIMQHIKEEPQSPPPTAEPDFDDSYTEPESELQDDLTAMEGGIELDQEIKFSKTLKFGESALAKPNSPSFMQGIYESFFTLLRDFFLESPDNKMSHNQLEEKVLVWQESPFSGLNEWFSTQSNWCELLLSAVRFLSGQTCVALPDSFSPYIVNRDNQILQWFGEERDSDSALAPLCQQWLDTRQDEDLNVDSFDIIPGSPPPPRVHTLWAVQPTSEDEKSSYRTQERERYENPHKASTFIMHGYEAVVGPVKGVYGKDSAMNKAREHSLLISDRPPFVTILSLVRDAAARLPNGEGTRADICELLRDSQFLAPAADSQIHTVVSGALDRLHYEKDPCVKYDVNRKTWIYLHRNRSEEEYERVHRAQATAAKTKKVVQKSKVKQPKSKSASKPSASDSQTAADVVNPSPSNAASRPLTPTATVLDAPIPKTPSNSHRAKTNQASKANKSHSAQKQTHPKQPPATTTPTPTPATVLPIVQTSTSVPAPATASHTVSETLPTNAIPILSRSSSAPVAVSAATTTKLDPPDIHPIRPSVSAAMSVGDSAPLIPASFIVTQATSGSNVTHMNSMTSSKAIISSMSPSQLLNIAQLQLMKSGSGPNATGNSPIVVVTTAPCVSAKVAPPKTVGAIMAQQQAAAAARAISVSAQQFKSRVDSQRLVSSVLPTQTHTIASLTNKPLVASTVVGSQPVTAASVAGVASTTGAVATAARMTMPTIVIQQQEGAAPTLVTVPTSVTHHQQQQQHVGVGAKMAPKQVARIISPPQVVSVGNLIASTLAATQKQGNPMQGATTTTTIKIQGSNLIRPIGQPAHLNVIQTSSAASNLAAQGTLSRLALVSQGSTASLIPVTGATVTAQPKLLTATSGPFGIVSSQLTTQQAQVSTVTKPTILSTPGGIKLMSAAQGATSGQTVSLAQLGAKPIGHQTTTATMMLTNAGPPRPTAPNSVASVMLTGTHPQRTLKPVVMAARPGIQPHHQLQQIHQHLAQQRPPMVSSVTTSSPVGPVNVKATLQGVKVIPVGGPASKVKSQPVFARIITPPGNLTLRPANLSPHLGGVLHAMQHHGVQGVPTLGTVRAVATGPGGRLPNATTTTIIRVQNPHYATLGAAGTAAAATAAAANNPAVNNPNQLSKDPQ